MDNIQRFLEISKQIESFFIHKRAILSDQKPELTLTEEIRELKAEIHRKDLLLMKYHQKLNKWTSIVNEFSSDKSSAQPNMASVPNVPDMRINQPGNIPQPNQLKTQLNSQMVPNSMMNSIRTPNPSMMPSPMNMNQSGAHQIPYNSNNNQPPQNHHGLQGPLAYLERTTAHIGINDNRR